jgi:hypothetical protein
MNWRSIGKVRRKNQAYNIGFARLITLFDKISDAILLRIILHGSVVIEICDFV